MENKNSEEIIVKFEEVTKQYGDLVELDKLNLNIKKNEKWYQ
jgi:ABC-type spermidine/putrescine transport systems, ATPase components